MDQQVDGDGGAVMRQRTFDEASGRWGPWETIFSRRKDEQRSFRFDFPGDKGYIEVHTNILPLHQQNALAEELRNCPYFLQYTIQGSPEPRLHFFLHGDATDTWTDPQPGYGYGRQITIKSRPLPAMKEVNRLADQFEEMYRMFLPLDGDAEKGCFWNIGVDCVLFRNGRDHMGYHADDDQGESLIVTVLVSTPEKSIRRIHIKPADRDKTGPKDGDVQIMLYLEAGDSYAMDGEMQKHYFHGVPSDKNSIVASDAADVDVALNQRMAIVLRRGIFKMQTHDTGVPCASLDPRVEIPYIFGGYTVLSELQEGRVYTRAELFGFHAHKAHQRGVCGNKDEGCASVIVSGLRPDGVGGDNFFHLMYGASVKEGALSLLRSAKEKKGVRVNRSSVLDSDYRAVVPANHSSPSTSQWYRFDGVYRIETVKYRDPGGPVELCTDITLTGVPKNRVFMFYLSRCQDLTGPWANAIADADYVQYCIDQRTMSERASLSLSMASPLPFTRVHLPGKPFVNQEFLCAAALTSLNMSTNIGSLLNDPSLLTPTIPCSFATPDDVLLSNTIAERQRNATRHEDLRKKVNGHEISARSECPKRRGMLHSVEIAVSCSATIVDDPSSRKENTKPVSGATDRQSRTLRTAGLEQQAPGRKRANATIDEDDIATKSASSVIPEQPRRRTSRNPRSRRNAQGQNRRPSVRNVAASNGKT